MWLLMNDNENLSVLDFLTVFSVFLQIMGFQQDQKQASNDDLLKALQKQNREYLDRIIENQNRILKLLQEDKVS
nr:MAG TPA: hypothetical protein [Bacteriophage sp.]